MCSFYSYWEDDAYKNRTNSTIINAVVFSLTTYCNLSCPECEANIPRIAYPEHYSIDSIRHASSCLFGIEHVAISGGEPTAHPQFRQIAKNLKKWFGCRSISLTTNGYKIKEYHDVMHHFDDILVSHYNYNRKEVDFLARQGLDRRPPGATIHVTTARRARNPGPCRRANFVMYIHGRLYPCGSVPSGNEKLGIPLTDNWRKAIMNVPLPCGDCCFAEEVSFSQEEKCHVKSISLPLIELEGLDELRPTWRWPSPRPDIAIYGLEADSWMGREAEIMINSNLGATRLLVEIESHALKHMHPINLRFDNSNFRKPYLCTVEKPGTSVVEIDLKEIPRSAKHPRIKVQCDTTYFPYLVKSNSSDTRELGVRIVSVRYAKENPHSKHIFHSTDKEYNPLDSEKVPLNLQFDRNAFRAILIPRFDTFGDIVLLQGFLKKLCKCLPDTKISLLVREGYSELKPMFPNQLRWLTTELDPYRSSPNVENVSSFFAKIKENFYDLVLTTTYNRTWADDLVAAALPSAWRVVLGEMSKMPDKLYNVLSQLGIKTFSCPYDQNIPVEETDHETEKYAVLWKSLNIKEEILPLPELSASTGDESETKAIIDKLGLTPNHFVVCCPGGVENVPIKKWPEDYFAQVILHFERQYSLPSLILAHEAEEQIASRVVQLASEQGAHPLIWLGKPGKFQIACSLVAKSLLYFGNDTGLMHIAGAFDKPVITVFGGGTWPRYIPRTRRGRAFVSPLPCFYCKWDCIFEKALCLTSLKPDVILRHIGIFIDELMSGNGVFEIIKECQLKHSSEEFGIDWIDIIKENEQKYRSLIKAKEEVIESQKAKLTANQIVISDFNAKTEKYVEITRRQESSLVEKEEIIQSQSKELLAKENVIQSLLRFRRSSLHYWCLRKPFYGLHLLTKVLQKKFHPKLEQFQQYDPVPLKIPQHYRETNVRSPSSLPVVSVVTPSFNSARFLERTIKSVLAQNYPKIEYIVHDGASTDGGAQILERYHTRIAHIESCKDEGQANALNLGFRHATGEIMAFLNSDDLLLPGAVSYIVQFFLDHPEVDVVYGHRIMIDENDQEIGRGVLPPHDETMLLWADYVPQETLFWRRRIWEKTGGYIDESFHFALDWELLLRFRDAGSKMARLPRFMGAFRVHSEQKSSAHLNTLGQQEMSCLRRRIHRRDVSQNEVRRHIRYYLLKHVIYDRLYGFNIVNY